MPSSALELVAVREPTPAPQASRPCARGKFFFRGSEKLYLRGVTYGTFRPDAEGHQYGTPASVRRDFRMMAASQVNYVRTYTAPPRWLLDIAHEHGLQVMVGLPWEQHITFLDDRRRTADVVARVRQQAHELAGHPALFCFAVGNEIPAPIVRWHGKGRVERLIHRLYDAVKAEDPEALVTYVNYPTTEYLELPFLDFVSFNVYLEERESFEAYLARLQSLAGDRPLVLAEVGLDSRRNGVVKQAQSLERQLRSSFAGGCAGAFVFSWSDEWYRGAPRSRTGTSASSAATASPSRRSRWSSASTPRSPSRAAPTGSASRWWSAPTTARAPSARPWSTSRASSTPTSR